MDGEAGSEEGPSWGSIGVLTLPFFSGLAKNWLQTSIESAVVQTVNKAISANQDCT